MREDRSAQRFKVRPAWLSGEDDLRYGVGAVVQRAEKPRQRRAGLHEGDREERKKRLRSVAVLLVSHEREEPEQVHGRDGVGRRGRAVEDLPRAEEKPVVVFGGEAIASGGIEEAAVELRLQLNRRPEVDRLERRLVEVEQGLDEICVVGSEAGDARRRSEE